MYAQFMLILMTGALCVLRENSPGEFHNDFILRENSPGELVTPVVRLLPGVVGPNWSTVAKGDFAGSLQWTRYKGANVFGPFGNQNVTLDVTGIISHDSVIVALELVTLGSWDGVNDNDEWLCVVHDDTVFASTFSTTTYRQNFPDVSRGRSYPARSGAVQNNSIGFRFTEPGVFDGTLDATYRLEFRRAHTNNSLTICLIGRLRDVRPNLRNEAWGLRSFDVSVLSIRHSSSDVPETPDIVPGR